MVIDHPISRFQLHVMMDYLYDSTLYHVPQYSICLLWLLLFCSFVHGPSSTFDHPHFEPTSWTSLLLIEIHRLAPHLTLVLLSSPTVETLGLLPYLVTRLRLACPIYATFPCRTLGQLTLEEWVEMRSSEEARDPLASSTSSSSAAAGNKKPTLDSRNSAPKLSGLPQPGSLRADDAAWRVSKEDIQLTFSRITPVVYSQVVRLSGRANSPFSLLAHPAGTTLGGTLWSLRSATTDSLLYAPIFNHVKERTLDPASFLIRGKEGRMEVNEAIRRIGILIIPSDKSLKTSTKAKERDKSFLDTITFTLRELNQSILLPVDTIGRFIEIMVLLEQHWAFSTLSPNYPLCMVSRNCEHILFTIRRLAEAFGGQLGADEAERERVLRFK
jgi:cleavage and polyadenylation specificity factor subunit 2